MSRGLGDVYKRQIIETSKSAFAFVGCFGFYAGKPDMEIVRKKPEDFTIMVPQNKEPLVI